MSIHINLILDKDKIVIRTRGRIRSEKIRRARRSALRRLSKRMVSRWKTHFRNRKWKFAGRRGNPHSPRPIYNALRFRTRTASAKIFVDTSYAPQWLYLTRGTKRHVIQARKRVLVIPPEKTYARRTIIAKKVMHPGVKPEDLIGEFYNTIQRDIEKFGKFLEEALRLAR